MIKAEQKKGDHPDRLVASSFAGILPSCCSPTRDPQGASVSFPFVPPWSGVPARGTTPCVHPISLVARCLKHTKRYPEYKYGFRKRDRAPIFNGIDNPTQVLPVRKQAGVE